MLFFLCFRHTTFQKEDVSMLNKKRNKIFLVFLLTVLITSVFFTVPVFAEDVAGAVTKAYNSYMQPQIKDIVDNVILRIIDIILIVAIIARLAMSGYNYKRNGNDFQWHLAAILGCGLIICLSAPSWIWNVVPGARA